MKQHEQQQRSLQYANPNLAQAHKVQENMKSVLENPMLNDEQKSSRYSNLMTDYQIYMAKLASPSSQQPPTAPYLQTSHTQLPTPRMSSFVTQPPPITPFPAVPPPFFRGTFPTPPDSSLKQQALDTPLPESVSDDDNRLETFVTLSDDDETIERKQRLAKRKYTRRGERRRKYPK